jgi:cutinase
VSLTPNSGAVGSKFVMAGKGWLPGGTVAITLPGTAPGFFESTTPFTPKVAADGTWQLTAIVGKPSAAGGYTFTYAETGCASQTGTFTVTASPPPAPSCSPSVSISPGSGPIGSKFALAGTGWKAGGSVKITLPSGSAGIFQASTWNPAVAANGTWQFTATVGKSPAGRFTFTFAESGCASRTATFTVTAPPPPPAACSQVWFIGARGSGEAASGSDGMGPGVDYMAKVLAAQLKAGSGQSLHLMPVNYSADPVNDLYPDNAVLLLIAAGEIPQALALYKETSVAEYDTSIESGMTVTLLDVASVLKRCSGARIILAGYSQGAIAVHNAENWIAAHVPSELRHIVGTLLLADGDRVANTKGTEFGTSLSSTTKGLRVSLGLVKPHDVPLPQSTASIANKNDIVADFAFSHFLTGISVHTHYAYKVTVNGKSQLRYDPALGEAAHWVASRVLAGV